EVPAAALGVYYPPTYGYLKTGTAQRRVQRTRVDSALHRPPLNAVTGATPGTLLDVGCGRGDLGAAFVRRGWRVSGVEPSAEACAVAGGREVDARGGTLASGDCGQGSFDAGVTRHPRDHVPGPKEDRGGALRLVRPGGL